MLRKGDHAKKKKKNGHLSHLRKWKDKSLTHIRSETHTTAERPSTTTATDGRVVLSLTISVIQKKQDPNGETGLE